MKRLLTLLFACGLLTSLSAQTLSPITWESYEIVLDAPQGMRTNEDGGDGFTAVNEMYELSIGLLEMEGLTLENMGDDLKSLSKEEGVSNFKDILNSENKDFHIRFLQGEIDNAPCLYAFLLAKDESCALFISIFYKEKNDKLPEQMLKSVRFKASPEA